MRYKYIATLTIESAEEIHEDEIANRVESQSFDPFIEVTDCHLEDYDPKEDEPR